MVVRDFNKDIMTTLSFTFYRHYTIAEYILWQKKTLATRLKIFQQVDFSQILTDSIVNNEIADRRLNFWRVSLTIRYKLMFKPIKKLLFMKISLH